MHRSGCLELYYCNMVLVPPGARRDPVRGHCNGTRYVVTRAAGESSVHRGRDRVLFIQRIPLSPTSLLTDSCTWRRRDKEVRKTFAFL